MLRFLDLINGDGLDVQVRLVLLLLVQLARVHVRRGAVVVSCCILGRLLLLGGRAVSIHEWERFFLLRPGLWVVLGGILRLLLRGLGFRVSLVERGKVLVPQGVWRLKAWLMLERSGECLRGTSLW